MRQRGNVYRRQLVKVLKNSQEDAFSEIALRGFWSLRKPLPVPRGGSGPELQTKSLEARLEGHVVDLAQWVRERSKAVST
ncbi:MAG TPA: hypothetical protein VN894_09410 [Polyangiaceae bacterium]|nr:hypothetical protein [Polyangiaceae bacterium]